MRRFALPLILLLLLGAAGFGVAQFNELGKLRATLSDLEKERAELRKRVWDLQKLNRDLAARLDRGSRRGGSGGEEEGEEGGPPGGPEGARTRGGRGGPMGRFAALFNNPEVQRLMAVEQKAALDGRYASLFRKLNLSPADLEKFKGLLVEKQSALMDVMAAAREQGLDPRTNRDEIRALVQNAQAEVDQSIRSALGDAAYSEYKSYEATMPQRTVVDQLNQRLSYSAAPLTDTQADQLVSILAATAPNNGGNNANAMFQAVVGRGGATTAFVGGGTRITDAAIAQAQGVLAPAQVAALQSLQEEQRAAAKLRQQLRNNGGGATRPTTPASAGGG
jgi:hypothetical protein